MFRLASPSVWAGCAVLSLATGGHAAVAPGIQQQQQQLPLSGQTSDFIDRFPHLQAAPDYNLGAEPDENPTSLGAISSISVNKTVPYQVDIVCGEDQLRVQFWRTDVVRVWLAWGGNFTDEASEDIVTGKPSATLTVAVVDKGEYYELSASDTKPAATAVTLRATKSPLKFALYRSASGELLLSESAPLSHNSTATYQSLAPAKNTFDSIAQRGGDHALRARGSAAAAWTAKTSSDGAVAEAFFGGGMQNGRFVHTGQRIRISNDFNWADGGNPNAAPWYLSSGGYGVYRNTWAPGFYDFSTDGSVTTGHNETDRFDAFYFGAPAARDFKYLLGSYTYLTGAPFMLPVYGLGLGDSDCYHNTRHNNNTRVVTAVADQYIAQDIPASWFLPNDGYGCGFGVGPSDFPKNFTELDATVADLHARGFVTGLWSSTGLPNITREVAGSGTRIAKTDVGWVGAGYKYAFDAIKQVTAGIEDNCDGRRFIWTVEGWAGTHRYAVMWAGDDSGSFDYLRWQLPTFAGAGFSAQAHVSGDIDGIFGGSPETYVRDLQFKSLMTTLMVMSGWAANPDKQPWTWGEPYTSINRRYLKLKASLTPFHYTLSRYAFDTGVPPVRAMALEFPSDDALLVNGTAGGMQFMVGGDLLVAPQYLPLGQGGDSRDGIYLPATPGGWVDYWTGDHYGDAKGVTAKTVDSFATPLETLPLFVRAGAIIPMWPEGTNISQAPEKLVLDIYPEGQSSFELYEDDGVTRKAIEGPAQTQALLRTNISVSAVERAMTKGGPVSVNIGAAAGAGFAGQATSRSYDIRIHRKTAAPLSITVVPSAGANITLPALNSLDAVRFSAGSGRGGGWFYSRATLGGVIHIAVPAQPTSSSFKVEISDGPVFPHVSCTPCGAKRQTFDYVNSVTPGNLGGKISERGSSPLLCVTASATTKDPDSGTPAIQMQPCSPTLDSTQVWIQDEAKGWLQLRGDTSSTCIDLDMTDRNLEMYHCNPAIIKHQQWSYDNSTGAFKTLQDDSCMTVIAPDSIQSLELERVAQVQVAIEAMDLEISAVEAQLNALQSRKALLQSQKL